MKNIETKDLYFCYSKQESDFLKRKGISYILKARSIKDGSVFTLYERNEILESHIKEFQNRGIVQHF